jgi:hypothetical protein
MSVTGLQQLPGLALKYGLVILFLLWVLMIVHGLLLGRIRTDGILRNKDGSLSSTRMQLLFTTLAALGCTPRRP